MGQLYHKDIQAKQIEYLTLQNKNDKLEAQVKALTVRLETCEKDGLNSCQSKVGE